MCCLEDMDFQLPIAIFTIMKKGIQSMAPESHVLIGSSKQWA